MGRLSPTDQDWPTANEDFSRQWVDLWVELADAVRKALRADWITNLDPQKAKLPADLEQRRALLGEMHALFKRVLVGGRNVVKEVASDLALLRIRCEPSADQAARGNVIIGRRWQAGRYFEWLAEALQEHWRAEGKGKASIGSPPIKVRTTGAKLAEIRAAQSYEWVCTKKPDLIPQSPKKYSREQWEHIKASDCPAYMDEREDQLVVPEFDTWKRQVRAGLQDPERPKTSPRAGRPHGSSIVHMDEV